MSRLAEGGHVRKAALNAVAYDMTGAPGAMAALYAELKAR